MAKRPRVGSVVEIKTRRGLAYGQVTHFHREPPAYGWLLRVFQGFHPLRPNDFESVPKAPVQFSTFYPVGSAANIGLVEIVAHVPVSASNAEFPLFKAGIENPETGEVNVWWIWDGTREWRAKAMTEEMLGYPIKGIVTGDLLHRLVEAEWTSKGRGAFGTPPMS